MLTNKEKLSKPTRVSQMSAQEIITIIVIPVDINMNN